MPDRPNAAEGRWSPFPVQDWSRLPADEWQGESRSTWDLADPNAAPPAPRSGAGWVHSRRREPVAMLVVALCLLLVAGSIFLADRSAVSQAQPTAVSPYAPADGAASYVERGVRSATGNATRAIEVVESARFAGQQAFAGLDDEAFAAVVGSLGGSDLEGAVLWRSTATRVGSQGVQRTDVFRVDRGIALVARFGERTSSGPVGDEAFEPALRLLPADPEVGDSWTGSGRSGVLTYESEFAVASAQANCLLVTGTLTYATRSGALTPQRWELTFCPARGLTRSVMVAGTDVVSTTTTAATRLGEAASLPSVDSAPTQRSWSPLDWQRRPYSTVTTGADFSERPPAGSAAQALGATTTSGLLFRVFAGSGDLIAVTPKAQETWRTLWRMHPGGQVLSLTAFGNVVVVTTSQRAMVAYDDSGERLWRFEADELMPQPPVRVDDTTIAVAALSGVVSAVSLEDGATRWSTALGADVAAPLTVAGAGPSTVVVGYDRDGEITGLGLADGAVRWQLAGTDPSRGVALGEDRVLIVDGTDLDAVDVATGRRVWRRPVRESVVAFAALGPPRSPRVVAASPGGSVQVDVDGALSPLPGYRALTTEDEAGGDWLVGWTSAGADLIDSTGRVRRSLTTAQVTVADQGSVVADRSGVLRFAADWSFEGLS